MKELCVLHSLLFLQCVEGQCILGMWHDFAMLNMWTRITLRVPPVLEVIFAAGAPLFLCLPIAHVTLSGTVTPIPPATNATCMVMIHAKLVSNFVNKSHGR